jgi:chromosome partitioning protein
MQRIVVLNPKGAWRKTTLAINLAAYFARAWRCNSAHRSRQSRLGHALVAQAQATAGGHHRHRHLRKRRPHHALLANAGSRGTQKIVVDSPAAVDGTLPCPDLSREWRTKSSCRCCHSDIDIHAVSRCIADLLLVAKIRRAENRIGVIANRVRKNTLMFKSLMRFLEKLEIPIVATVRDSQNYVRAAEQGVGIHEMKPSVVKEDLAQWESLFAWLEPERVLA